MYITRDYLKLDPWTALIQMVNNNYNYELSPGMVELKRITKLGPTKTEFEIIPNRSRREDNQLPYVGQTIFTFDRLDAGLFFRTETAVNISGLQVPFTTMDVLRQIGLRNDIVFTVDDFVNVTYDHFSYTTEPDITITASPLSMRFVGSMKIRLVNTLRKDLGLVPVSKVEFPSISKAWNAEKISGDFYTSRYDFTTFRETLRAIPVGLYHNPESLLMPLYMATGQYWECSTTAKPFNLTHTLVQGERHCKILYNGPPIPGVSNRIGFNRVLVIELSDALSTGISGFLRLHYN